MGPENLLLDGDTSLWLSGYYEKQTMSTGAPRKLAPHTECGSDGETISRSDLSSISHTLAGLEKGLRDLRLHLEGLQVLETQGHDSVLAKLKQEQEHFESIKKSLIVDPAYKDRYVAILNKQVVDADSNEMDLVERISSQIPNEIVFIGLVSNEDPHVDLPSPEVVEI